MSRRKIGAYGKRMFKRVANKTNVKNLPNKKMMMRGGFHQ